MAGFEYFLPIRLVFGCGKLSELGKFTGRYGTKALVVTGRTSAKKTGLLERAVDYLRQENIDSVIFDKVEENPLTTTVEEGVKTLKSAGCDVVVGLGGGSAVDAAKGIAFSAVNPGDISEYIFGKQGKGALPLIAVTTTAGTGTEGNSLAVLTNPETKDKKSLKSPFIYPKVSIVDPELMKTLPKPLIAATGFDALCHAIEAYVSRRSNPLSDMMAIKAIEIISCNLPKVYQNSQDMNAWENMALASTLGGMVIDIAGVALAHGLEHSVSGLLNVRHGEGLAALLVTFMEYSYQDGVEKFSNIAKAMGEEVHGLSGMEAARKSIDAVKKLL